jgi:hypothetical protein
MTPDDLDLDPDDPEAERERIRSFVMARCGDTLSEDQIALAFAGADDDRLPASVTGQIMLVLDRMTDRLDNLENGARPN